MTVVSTKQDTDALTLTVVSDLAAPPERVWELWVDARQLERWWGPPTWPATFEQHDVVVGGRSRYFMTGPEGDKAGGWWEFVAIDAPRSLEFEDGFSDASGSPSTEMPVMRMRADLEATANGTRMTITTTLATVDQLKQITEMGMVEGMTGALNQIDALLAAA
jgi:uncharacterized protein YndB with AHSA1/START domain